ncbi:ester cyclase [soil metagenome]
MSAADNEAAIRHGIEQIFNLGNLAVLDERCTPDVVVHSPAQAEPMHGRATLEEFVLRLRTAFPDLHVAIDDLVADDRTVVTRCTTRGTQDGDYFGVPPTGSRVRMTEVQIFRIADGRIVELWLVFNVLDVLQQLGVVPAGGLPRPLLLLLARLRRRRNRRRALSGSGSYARG